MSGTTKWKEIRDKRIGSDTGRRGRAREAMVAELRLAELRKHRHMSQEAVAERLQISQPSVSQFERTQDLHLSTIQGYVGALGGRLELVAVFDDERITIGAS